MASSSSLAIVHQNSGKLYSLLLALLVGTITFFSGLVLAQTGATLAGLFISSWFNFGATLLTGLFLFFCLAIDDYTIGKYRLVLLALTTIISVLTLYDIQDSFNFITSPLGLKIEAIRHGNMIKAGGGIIMILSLVGILFHLGTEQESEDGYGHHYDPQYGFTYTMQRKAQQPQTPVLPVMRETIALSPMSPLSPNQLDCEFTLQTPPKSAKSMTGRSKLFMSMFKAYDGGLEESSEQAARSKIFSNFWL